MIHLMEKDLLHLKPFLVFDDDDNGETEDVDGSPRRSNGEAADQQQINRRCSGRPATDGCETLFSLTQLQARMMLQEIPTRARIVLHTYFSQDNVLRGPLLMSIGCSVPCITFAIRRITVYAALQGISVLILVGVGAYWFIVDVTKRARALRDRAVATAQHQLQTIVVDDTMQQLFSPNYEGINVVQILGMATAGSVLYCIPMVTLEHRILLVQSALGLTREQAETLLCRPGGLQVLWNLYNQGIEPATQAQALDTLQSDRNARERSGCGESPAVSHAAQAAPERSVDCTISHSVGLEDQTPKLVASDETSSERSVDDSPVSLQTLFPGACHVGKRSRGQATDALNSRLNVDEVRWTHVVDRMPPHRSQTRAPRDDAPSTVPVDADLPTPWTILRSIVMERLSQEGLLPSMPKAPSEALSERCLTVSVGVLCLQLVFSRRARQIVSGAMQATVIATSSALATLSVSLIMLLYGVDMSDQPSLASSSHAGGFDQVSRSFSRHVTRWIHSQWLAPIRHPSPPPLPSMTNAKTNVTSRLLELLHKGWRTVEGRVARPMLQLAVQQRHSLSAFALILILARWKEERRRQLLRAGAAKARRRPTRLYS